MENLFMFLLAVAVAVIMFGIVQLVRVRQQLRRLEAYATKENTTPESFEQNHVSKDDVLRRADYLRRNGWRVEVFEDGLGALAHRKRTFSPSSNSLA